MDFKKRFDNNNINSFLPDNQTIATSEYFNKKFNGKLPDYVCDILEVKSRKDFKEEEEEENMYINMIKESAVKSNENLIKEFDERSNRCPDLEQIEIDESITILENAK